MRRVQIAMFSVRTRLGTLPLILCLVTLSLVIIIRLKHQIIVVLEIVAVGLLMLKVNEIRYPGRRILLNSISHIENHSRYERVIDTSKTLSRSQ